MSRIALDIILLLSIFIFPWWISLLLGAALSFVFKNYYELVVAGIITDLLYGHLGSSLLDVPIFYTLLYGAILILVYNVSIRLRHNAI